MPLQAKPLSVRSRAAHHNSTAGKPRHIEVNDAMHIIEVSAARKRRATLVEPIDRAAAVTTAIVQIFEDARADQWRRAIDSYLRDDCNVTKEIHREYGELS